MNKWTYILFLIAGYLAITQTGCSLVISKVDYNTDVKPILNQKCISCHGGVKQSAGFSLLSRDRALAETESGKPAIIPGSSHESEFIRRLTLDDLDERMPLDGEPLSKDEIKILTKWVDQGAEWGLHWAYRPLTSEPEVLTMGNGESKDFISARVNERLKKEGLSMNSKASDSELLRRVAFDLIGMPAPLNLQDAYLQGQLSYLDLLDSLFAMDEFGEKWATMWLDVARYADSKGFERDQSRSIWRYRDYVIDAFNTDKPYDQFLIEQLAGDMLPSPTEEQLIATGFHRNTATNDEGGTDNEEFRVKAVMDRINTTWEGIMGTTMACVQCHGHPYDPFPHKDYYSTMAFLNNTRDADTAKDYPLLNFLDSLSEQEVDVISEWIASTSQADRREEVIDFIRVSQPIIYSIETEDHQNAALYDTKYLGFRNGGSAMIPDVDLTGKQAMWINMYSFISSGKLEILLDSIDGQLLVELPIRNKDEEYKLIEVLLPAITGVHDLYLRFNSPQLGTTEKRGLSIDWFYFGTPFPGKPSRAKDEMWDRYGKLINGDYNTTLIMVENPADRRRETHLFDRGNWQVHLDQVEAATPGILPPMREQEKKDRLAFAKWIASEENPLTSRTYVNRIWEQIFGLGIVRTVEDLGSQGDRPTHPELLDELAYRFVTDDEWSTKNLLKRIMSSDVYKQSAVSTSEKINRDPYNALLSRGPRNRLTAEQIRDQGLFLSGLLVQELHGPPVMPYQPEGIWNTPYNSEQWKMSEGKDRYRRAIYTMVKRTSIYPAMETFDMASRQVCTSRRIDSNTPLQALVTLNDPAFAEISAEIGGSILGEANVGDGIKKVYSKAMSKEIHPQKLQVLVDLYKEMKTEEGATDSIAAMTVANALINLDDLLNK